MFAIEIAVNVAAAVQFGGGGQAERLGDERVGVHAEIRLRTTVVNDGVVGKDGAERHAFAKDQFARGFGELLKMNRNRAKFNRHVLFARLKNDLARVSGLFLNENHQIGVKAQATEQQ